MIWQPARLECRSKTFTGCESPSMLQWYTAVSVTSATVFREIHFQNVTSSVIVCAFILLFISMLKIWRVFAAGGNGRSEEGEHVNICSEMETPVQKHQILTEKWIFRNWQSWHSDHQATEPWLIEKGSQTCCGQNWTHNWSVRSETNVIEWDLCFSSADSLKQVYLFLFN